MKEKLKILINKTREKLDRAAHALKDKVEEMSGAETYTIEDIANFITSHPDTKLTKKNYLGMDYYFHKLEYYGFIFYMESKASHILQLDVQSPAEPVVSYRSYKDSADLSKSVESAALDSFAPLFRKPQRF